jgi:hypothetical protein
MVAGHQQAQRHQRVIQRDQRKGTGPIGGMTLPPEAQIGAVKGDGQQQAGAGNAKNARARTLIPPN